jgi:hypothetical protein
MYFPNGNSKILIDWPWLQVEVFVMQHKANKTSRVDSKGSDNGV